MRENRPTPHIVVGAVLGYSDQVFCSQRVTDGGPVNYAGPRIVSPPGAP
jgi:hypothetical protein